MYILPFDSHSNPVPQLFLLALLKDLQYSRDFNYHFSPDQIYPDDSHSISISPSLASIVISSTVFLTKSTNIHNQYLEINMSNGNSSDCPKPVYLPYLPIALTKVHSFSQLPRLKTSEIFLTFSSSLPRILLPLLPLPTLLLLLIQLVFILILIVLFLLSSSSIIFLQYFKI